MRALMETSIRCWIIVSFHNSEVNSHGYGLRQSSKSEITEQTSSAHKNTRWIAELRLFGFVYAEIIGFRSIAEHEQIFAGRKRLFRR